MFRPREVVGVIQPGMLLYVRAAGVVRFAFGCCARMLVRARFAPVGGRCSNTRNRITMSASLDWRRARRGVISGPPDLDRVVGRRVDVDVGGLTARRRVDSDAAHGAPVQLRLAFIVREALVERFAHRLCRVAEVETKGLPDECVRRLEGGMRPDGSERAADL